MAFVVLTNSKSGNINYTQSKTKSISKTNTITVNFKTLIFAAMLFASSNALAPAATQPGHMTTALNVGCVPDGLSPQEHERIRKQDKQRLGKELGRLGPKGFKSRSMEAWQMACERGETSHTFAPLGCREKLKKGEIKKEQVPCMVRGGSWDNSDVFGAIRQKWSNKDREHAKGGCKKEQSASILGSGPGFDWTGTRSREENKVKKIVPGFS